MVFYILLWKLNIGKIYGNMILEAHHGVKILKSKIMLPNMTSTCCYKF